MKKAFEILNILSLPLAFVLCLIFVIIGTLSIRYSYALFEHIKRIKAYV